MTESRDQRFFDALSGGGPEEVRGAQPDAPTSAGAADTAPPGSSPPPAHPLHDFAADDSEDDPDNGRHHTEPPAGDVGGGGGWGQPARQAEPRPQPWPHGAARGGTEDSPFEAPSQARSSGMQHFPLPPRASAAPTWPPGDLTEHGGAAMPPPPASRDSSPTGQQPPPAVGPEPQAPASLSSNSPRPIPPEERTEFISRDVLREATARSATPPPGWAAQGGAPRPPGCPRPTPPPGWPPRPQLAQPPAAPGPPSGPRPPQWGDWGAQNGGSGGAELRGEQFSAAELNVPRKIPSSHGWRKWLYHGSFKLINTGESPDEQLLRNLNATVAGHLRGTYSIVVLGGKGGVGKTTTTAAVGSTFASLRTDKTIAMDANPDRASNLADRIDPSATDSYKDVLSDPNLQRYSDIRSHVGLNEAGLDVLGNRYQSDRQPLTAQTYLDTHDRLQRFYSVLISDSGTDVDHPVIPGLMDRADALIMVASTAPDGAKGAAELMDWAYEAGYHRLLGRTVVVINDVRGENGRGHRKLVDSLVEKFSRWVGPQRVFVVPFDPHIASAGVIKLNELRPATRRCYLEVTAKVATGFNSSEDRP